jgi:hypothetical protein
MLRSVNRLFGHQLRAIDGDIGRVQDFTFDEMNWVIRYLSADTGPWLPGRQVLITPHAVGSLGLAEPHLHVKLLREQIEDCPLIEAHQPVSRQFEEQLYQHYGLTYYWQGRDLWGMNGFPVSDLPSQREPKSRAYAISHSAKSSDPRLHSARSVHGYRIEYNHGIIGHISDFLIDEHSWAIRHLVIKSGGWHSGQDLQIWTGHLAGINHEARSVMVQQSISEIDDSRSNRTASSSSKA